jgi:hypothetical protein
VCALVAAVVCRCSKRLRVAVCRRQHWNAITGHQTHEGERYLSRFVYTEFFATLHQALVAEKTPVDERRRLVEVRCWGPCTPWAFLHNGVRCPRRQPSRASRVVCRRAQCGQAEWDVDSAGFETLDFLQFYNTFFQAIGTSSVRWW